MPKKGTHAHILTTITLFFLQAVYVCACLSFIINTIIATIIIGFTVENTTQCVLSLPQLFLIASMITNVVYLFVCLFGFLSILRTTHYLFVYCFILSFLLCGYLFYVVI